MMKKLIIAMIKFYRKYISPYKRTCCIFVPSCSTYALQAVEKYGALKGSWMALKRLLRCHPFHGKDFDPYDPVV